MIKLSDNELRSRTQEVWDKVVSRQHWDWIGRPSVKMTIDKWYDCIKPDFDTPTMELPEVYFTLERDVGRYEIRYWIKATSNVDPTFSMLVSQHYVDKPQKP